jgi:hypothetical protein
MMWPAVNPHRNCRRRNLAQLGEKLSGRYEGKKPTANRLLKAFGQVNEVASGKSKHKLSNPAFTTTEDFRFWNGVKHTKFYSIIQDS